MGKGSSAPPAPDYTAAAQAQGAANLDAARATAKLSNPNINSPYGSQTVTYGTPIFDQAGYDKALAAYNSGGSPDTSWYYRPETPGQVGEEGMVIPGQNGGWYNSSGGYNATQPTVSGVAPTREQFTTVSNPDVPTVTQTLNPESQQIFDAQQATRLGLADLSGNALTMAQDVLNRPFYYNGPGVQTSLGNYGPVQGGVNSSGEISQAPAASQYGMQTGFQPGGNILSSLQGMGQIQYAPNAQGYSPQTSFQSSGSINSGPQIGDYGYASGLTGNYGSASAGPAANQYGSAGANVTAGAINQGPSVGQYGYAQQGVQGPNLQAQVDTSGIANMPINAGTTAQQAIMSRLQPQIDQSNNAYAAQLANQGIVQGSEAYDNAMRVHNQANNDLLTQAALQGIGLDLTANQQGYNQALQSGQFANQSALSGFGANLQNAQLFNAGQGQNYAQAIAAQQAQNAAQQQGYGQSLGTQQLQNAAIAQNFGQGQAATQLANQAQAQNFGQGITGQQLSNQATAQNYQQAIAAQQAQNAAQQQGFGQNQAQAQFFNTAQGQAYQQALAQQAAQNAAQQQGFNQNLAGSQFTNAAQQQAFGQNQAQAQFYNQAQALAYQQAIAQQQAQNAAQQQQYGQNLNSAQFANQAQNQAFNQGLASAQFGNTAQQQALQQAFYQRELPLNEISALMSGSQIQNPTFPGYAGTQVQPAPLYNAATNQYNSAMQNYGLQNASNNAFNSGLFSLAGAGLQYAGTPAGAATLASFSDRRLKSKIVRIGTHPLGIGIYRYEIFGQPDVGVMADEVLSVMPEAVSLHPSGFMQVDYGRL